MTKIEEERKDVKVFIPACQLEAEYGLLEIDNCHPFMSSVSLTWHFESAVFF